MGSVRSATYWGSSTTNVHLSRKLASGAISYATRGVGREPPGGGHFWTGFRARPDLELDLAEGPPGRLKVFRSRMEKRAPDDAHDACLSARIRVPMMLMIVCWLVRTLSRISLLASFCPEALLLAHLAAGDLHDF